MTKKTTTTITCDVCGAKVTALPSRMVGSFHHAPNKEQPHLTYKVEVVFKIGSTTLGSVDHHGDYYGNDVDLCADCVFKSIGNIKDVYLEE